MMNLTRMYQSPEDYLPPLSTEVLEDHEEMELLLEAYLQVNTHLSSLPLLVHSAVRICTRCDTTFFFHDVMRLLEACRLRPVCK